MYSNRKIWKWDEYYQEARRRYHVPLRSLCPGGSDLYDLTIKVHDPYRSNNDLFQTDEQYLSIINRMHEKCKVLFQNPDVYERQGMAHGLKDNWVMESELKDLINILKPQLEQKIFHSHVHVDNIKIYRSFVTSESPKSSWVFHTDNSPQSQIKILIYLTDVTGDEDGQYEFVTRDSTSFEGIKVPTSKNSYENWIEPWNASFRLESYDLQWFGTDRIPDSILNSLFNKHGCRLAKIIGQKGKLILFDNNIIHRATTCRKSHRDAIVIQFKPSLKPVEFSSKTCGNGWRHTTFNVCPSIQELILRNEQTSHANQLEEIRKVLSGDRELE